MLLQGQAYGKAQTRIKISCHQGLDPSVSPATSLSKKDSLENHSLEKAKFTVSFKFLQTLQLMSQMWLCFPRPHGTRGKEL